MKLKKRISLLLAVVLSLTALPAGLSVQAADAVAINSDNFTDRNFRSVVSEWYDEDGDGYLSANEVANVTLISVSGMLMDTCGDDAQITDLKGIEYFTDCKRLRCGGIGLTKLDVSKMPQLVELTCAGNELTSLNTTANTKLEWLNCSSNSLGYIDVSKNTALTKLDCYVNSLTQLDLIPLTGLNTLRCHHNELASLDVSTCTQLKTLNCSNNHLKDLDLSANTQLTEVTNSYIGNQVVSSVAQIKNGSVIVPLTLKSASNIVSTSLDKTEIVDEVETIVSGYVGTKFVADSIDSIADGVDYTYSTGLENAENMSVHVNITRDFHQVKYYTNSEMQTLIATEIVNNGEAGTPPEITDVPQCKAFSSWSEDLSSVTEDMNVYAVWTDNHDIKIISFKNNVLEINCSKCGNVGETHNFSDMADKRTGENGYVALADVNADGIINGKDFAMLLRAYKNA